MVKKKLHEFHEEGFGAALAVNLKPNARTSRIRKINREGTVFIDLADEPTADIDQRLCGFLAAFFGLSAAQVDVLGRSPSNNRLVMINGMSPAQVDKRLRTRNHR